MIKGNYELVIRFDVSDKGKALKELRMANAFSDSTEFVKNLLSDLDAAGPLVDRYIPTGPKGEGEKDADIQV